MINTINFWGGWLAWTMAWILAFALGDLIVYAVNEPYRTRLRQRAAKGWSGVGDWSRVEVTLSVLMVPFCCLAGLVSQRLVG